MWGWVRAAARSAMLERSILLVPRPEGLMKIHLQLPLLLALMVPAPNLGAQIYAEVEAAQLDSLGSTLTKELRRVTGLTLVPGISETTRALNAFVYNSTREASEISTRLQFIETLRAESPDN